MNLQPMKAISMWQPWASLLACRAKKYETRSWQTKYRGPIAIHETASEPRKLFYLMVDKIFDLLGKENPLEYPRGAIIATAELVGCHKMVLHGGRGISSTDPGWLETESGIYYPTEQELILGDWTPGRYAWEFANMTMLPEPIPAKGRQGLWNWGGQP